MSNKIVHAGEFHGIWIECALEYLPPCVYDDIKDRLIIVSNTECAGCRIPRSICHEKEIILISELLYPEDGSDESCLAVRHLIFVVLHEIAHAVLKHSSPTYDNLSKDEEENQERHADGKAFAWFNEATRKKPLKEMTSDELSCAEKEVSDRRKLYYNTN